MATITITFANEVNTSLQALTDTASRDNVFFKDTAGNIHFVGECTNISADKKTITVDVGSGTTRQTPTTSDFVFFGKNNKINSSALLGYFAEVTMKTTETTEMELFSVGANISESSK